MYHREVMRGIYQVGGADLTGGGDCSVYLIDVTDNKFVLIDSGAGSTVRMILRNMRDIGCTEDDVEALFLTHRHIDHIGGASQLKMETGCDVITHELEKDAIENGDWSVVAEIYGVEYKTVTVDLTFNQSEKNYKFGDTTFKAIWTPGHTPGSFVVLMERDGKKVLFGQDVHGPIVKEWGGVEEDWKASLIQMMDMDADILCEGHFGIIQPKSAVRAYIERYLFADKVA